MFEKRDILSANNQNNENDYISISTDKLLPLFNDTIDIVNI